MGQARPGPWDLEGFTHGRALVDLKSRVSGGDRQTYKDRECQE